MFLFVTAVNKIITIGKNQNEKYGIKNAMATKTKG
jgi:hypothetical protein